MSVYLFQSPTIFSAAFVILIVIMDITNCSTRRDSQKLWKPKRKLQRLVTNFPYFSKEWFESQESSYWRNRHGIGNSSNVTLTPREAVPWNSWKPRGNKLQRFVTNVPYFSKEWFESHESSYWRNRQGVGNSSNATALNPRVVVPWNSWKPGRKLQRFATKVPYFSKEWFESQESYDRRSRQVVNTSSKVTLTPGVAVPIFPIAIKNTSTPDVSVVPKAAIPNATVALPSASAPLGSPKTTPAKVAAGPSMSQPVAVITSANSSLAAVSPTQATSNTHIVTPDPASLRMQIPNPGMNLNDSDAKEILKLIMTNPLIKAKFENALGSPGVIQGDWKGGCLAKDTKFPTINLKLNNNITSSNIPADGSLSKAQEIRINKFYGVKRDRFYILNTGNGMISIKFEPDAPTTEASIRGENWEDEYILAKGDLYWSLDNNHGGQHAIEGQPYALELQLVHYAKKYHSLEAASQQKGGIVVTSILFEAFGKHNPALEALANAAVAVGFTNNKWRQVHGVLDLKMLFPVDMSYFTYDGSYIADPCVQAVTWYVFRNPQIVSYIQLQKFREVRDHNSKRSSGVFMPLSSSNDSTGNERMIKSSGNEPSFLVVVPEVVLNVGLHLQTNEMVLIVTIMTTKMLGF